MVFAAVTVPLTVGASDDNVRREQYNKLVRAKYGDTGRLFDLARVESTDPDGNRLGWLYSGYLSDADGHLNAQGSRVAARKMLRVIARAG